MKNKYLLLLASITLLMLSCGDETFDCSELELNFGNACTVISPDSTNLNGIVSDLCDCLTLIQFDCQQLELNFGDSCTLASQDINNMEGIISESCECLPIPFDCLEINAFIGDECIDEQNNSGQVGLNCQCETGFLNISVELNKPAEILLGSSENSLIKFEIVPLSIGFAVSAKPRSNIQILDSSTFGYPDALDLNDEISINSSWSTGSNFVLGTSVGNAGRFEGVGEKFLGFRVLENEKVYHGWLTLNNNSGNTLLLIGNYHLNYNSEESILAGQY